MKARSSKTSGVKRFQWTVTTGFALFVLVPLLWLFYVAFLPPHVVLEARLLPTGFSLANFGALAGSGVWRALGVPALVSGAAVTGQLAFGLAAAYAIRAGVRVQWLVLLVLAIPSELLLVPLYRELQTLRLLDTIWALVVPFLASPLVIFLLLQALRRLPWDVTEAARLDGAGELLIVTRIVAPMLRPQLLAAAVIGFAAHWNLVLYPKVMVGRPELWTVQVWLTELLRSRPLDWGVLGAGALLTTLPLVILYLLFDRRIISMFEASFE